MIDTEDGVEIEEGVTFCNTSIKIEVTMGYSITGAPYLEHRTTDGQLAPCSARFTFRDGEISDVVVTARVVSADGEIGESKIAVPNIYVWNMQNWPVWLNDLCRLAHIDFMNEQKAK